MRLAFFGQRSIFLNSADGWAEKWPITVSVVIIRACPFNCGYPICPLKWHLSSVHPKSSSMMHQREMQFSKMNLEPLIIRMRCDHSVHSLKCTV